jgi:hypothetical protein
VVAVVPAALPVAMVAAAVETVVTTTSNSTVVKATTITAATLTVADTYNNQPIAAMEKMVKINDDGNNEGGEEERG